MNQNAGNSWLGESDKSHGGRLMLIVKYTNGKKAKAKANLLARTYEYSQ